METSRESERRGRNLVIQDNGVDEILCEIVIIIIIIIIIIILVSGYALSDTSH